jgi:methanethiol S-methyltransferase
MQTATVTAIVFILFAAIHSLTVSARFKDFVRARVGDARMKAYYRLWFTLVAFITLFIAVAVIWLQPDRILYRLPFWANVICRLIQLGGIALLYYAMKPFDAGFFSGTKQARQYRRAGKVDGDIEGIEHNELITTGAYGLVRHPMYVGSILLFLFEPVISIRTLVLRVFAVAYFFWGMWIEERRYMKTFGEQYRQYQEKVPKFNIFRSLN